MTNTQTLEWEYQTIPMTAIIEYSQKDYSFELISPLAKKFSGGHLLYVAPVVYELTESMEDGLIRDRIRILNLRPRVIEQCNQWINERMQIC
jgi:kynureninase